MKDHPGERLSLSKDHFLWELSFLFNVNGPLTRDLLFWMSTFVYILGCSWKRVSTAQRVSKIHWLTLTFSEDGMWLPTWCGNKEMVAHAILWVSPMECICQCTIACTQVVPRVFSWGALKQQLTLTEIWYGTRPRALTAELTHQGVNQCLKDVTQAQQQRPESPMVTLFVVVFVWCLLSAG